MPAYNEAEGIVDFLTEIQAEVRDCAESVEIIVADDRSTDDTPAAIAAAELTNVRVAPQSINRGHGPTALAAYREGLSTGAAVVLHVDGDGQFLGSDIARTLRALDDTGADVVHGVRQSRTDPWYRRVLTFALRLVISPVAGRSIPDINTPLRAYRQPVLADLVAAVGPDAQVPHVHFSLLEARSAYSVRYLRVRSIPRRGAVANGTMWGVGRPPALPPQRLRAFVKTALLELWNESLRPGAPLRRGGRAKGVTR